ncbi:hypothetical protein OJAV_G00039640 [Oryzias javanicus]|uniref:Uncharacterized protein n=1 Tax=Oryzias javanicus TaxID=123683 RepID=A0A3S2PXJ1_ORYJA|nr:hypothetical protein OJAV_G00039640 [Oryzias javanicus]
MRIRICASAWMSTLTFTVDGNSDVGRRTSSSAGHQPADRPGRSRGAARGSSGHCGGRAPSVRHEPEPPRTRRSIREPALPQQEKRTNSP